MALLLERKIPINNYKVRRGDQECLGFRLLNEIKRSGIEAVWYGLPKPKSTERMSVASG